MVEFPLPKNRQPIPYAVPQASLRGMSQTVLLKVPHQLCHFRIEWAYAYRPPVCSMQNGRPGMNLK